MKKLASVLLCIILLTGCADAPASGEKQYTATFLNYFDTVTTVVGYAESEEEFQEKVAPIRDGLEFYHRLFDIYNEYDGINNLKTLNDSAHLSPVKVDPAIIQLLSDCREYYSTVGGAFNPAMGSVLSLWHDAREDSINDPENAYLPDLDDLTEASRHTDPEAVVIDTEEFTVFFSDPKLKLDVGAVAKGWAVQKVCETAPEGLLISVGGNVCATGPKGKDGTPWSVGIKDPDNGNDYLHILNITRGCVVTSGSYQRAYAVDGRLYHHIIDPKTLFPSEYWTSVSVVCEDSGLADVLSTSLFILGREDGQALLDRLGAVAMWVDTSGEKYYSPGFEELIKK